MADGSVTVQCPDCGVGSEVADLDQSRWGCSNCGWAYFLRRCSACGQAGFVTALQGWHQPWECAWCAAFNSGFSQYNDPATATIAELAADLAHRGLSPAPTPEPTPEPSDVTEPADSVTQPIPVITGIGHDQVPWAPPPRPRRHRVRHILESTLAVAAIVVAAVLVLLAARPVSAGSERATAMSGASVSRTPGPTTRAVSVTTVRADAVDFLGVPGRLTVVAADTGRVTLTGELHWAGRPPIAVTRLDRGSHRLLLSYRCAPASLCTENYRLTVPRYAAVALRQPPGQVTLSGLAGPLQITANGVHVSATGLRSATLLAKITSGDLNAGFAAPPSRVAVTLVSAQATLGLPRRAAYRISQRVTEGYVQADVPQDPAAARTVTVCIRSGELTLLPELFNHPAFREISPFLGRDNRHDRGNFFPGGRKACYEPVPKGSSAGVVVVVCGCLRGLGQVPDGPVFAARRVIWMMADQWTMAAWCWGRRS
jgi:ribosomal protein S27AE